MHSCHDIIQISKSFNDRDIVTNKRNAEKNTKKLSLKKRNKKRKNI